MSTLSQDDFDLPITPTSVYLSYYVELIEWIDPKSIAMTISKKTHQSVSNQPQKLNYFPYQS